MTSLPATTNQSASHKGIANQIDIATRSRNAQVIKNMSGAGPLRNRSFGTGGRCRLPASAAVCLIPCLILWFAYVESVCKCRAPNSPGGLNGRIALVIASLFSSSRPPPPARASYLEHLILPTATATTPPPASIPTTARSGEHPPHKSHVVGLAVLIRLAAADGDQHAVAVAGADGDPPARSQSHSVRHTPAERGDYCSSLHPRRFAGTSGDHCWDPRHPHRTGVSPHQ